MRVAIREQLAALVIFSVLVALAIVAIPTWISVNNFVIGVRSDGLALTASLKAARISSEIELIQTACQTISTRVQLQNALFEFYSRNYHNITDKDDPFQYARDDLVTALGRTGFSSLLQARLYSRNTTGPSTGLLNVTGIGATDGGRILLPYKAPDGSDVYLGDEPWGYPPQLYPNVTYRDLDRPSAYFNNTSAFSAEVFPGVSLGNGSSYNGVLLGPLVVNSSFALISITTPVRYTGNGFILGYMTLVAMAKTLVDVQTSREGLGRTGAVLFVGSTNVWNHFNDSVAASNATWTPPEEEFERQKVHFLLPPPDIPGESSRHEHRRFSSGRYDQPFEIRQFPIVRNVLGRQNDEPNNATSILSSTNEQGRTVAVGAARPQTSLVSWAVVVEQDESEAFEPMRKLRTILLGCVFGTLGLVLLITFPIAHWSVKPITRLKMATENSIAPPGYEQDDNESWCDIENRHSNGGCTTSGKSEKRPCPIERLRRKLRHRRKTKLRQDMAAIESKRRAFKIPARVEVGKHLVTDELTELTQTFNAMTDELLKQYTLLDEKVAERTRELEISKKAAEAANESKTLFVANISHELKTPLNGIMGMCAYCLAENDIGKIKKALNTIQQSGELLLHLLEDLLSFSKNQIGQQIALEETAFRLNDLRQTILGTFRQQVKDKKVNFSVTFVGIEGADAGEAIGGKKLPALAPGGIGRLKDMTVWGDQHRIMQVIMNLVSNSLKFTPPGGQVSVRIRCLGEAEQGSDDSRASSFSRSGSGRGGRTRHRMGSTSVGSGSAPPLSVVPTPPSGGTALAINPLEPKTQHVSVRERSPTPPPPNAKTYLFEFEVEDTGPGIPESMHEKIFEPFVQGELGLNKKYGGTGLGLSICSQLATLMGGHITLRSQLGVGTTFTMQIPLKYVKDRNPSSTSSSLKSRPGSIGSVDAITNGPPSKRNSAEMQSPPSLDQSSSRLNSLTQALSNCPKRMSSTTSSSSTLSKEEQQMAALTQALTIKPSEKGGKLRVLVADDNTVNIEVVSRLLKLESIYDVTIAKDGQEAYELVKNAMETGERFDVIFMDIQMPNLDGLQSTRLIRALGYNAPIVALTAFSEESNVKECMESGMNEFLSKPIRRPALKQVLAKFSTILEEPGENGSVHVQSPNGGTPARTPEGERGNPMEKGASTVNGNGSPSDGNSNSTSS